LSSSFLIPLPLPPAYIYQKDERILRANFEGQLILCCKKYSGWAG
jgi:hypothetical protein